ncbi:atp-dependent rna and dna helicase [Holotrichia oblita]|uniref:Atp-dependent rna and dna helicase n=1 Tax=Holotrichia oblita TaxID=644536 RepID=A0ACB9TJ72_HOLOL|nr:atp-dependent rna and dna helicase [Holotrichia oblita]
MPKPKKTFHVEPPPILPDIEEQLREYIVCTERLPIHEYERNQEFWPRKRDITSLFEWTDSPLCSTLRISRDPLTGKILDFIEVPIKGAGANARIRCRCLERQDLLRRRFEVVIRIFHFGREFSDPLADLSLKEEDLTSELLTVAPGLDRGLYFKSDGVTVTDEPEVVESGFNLKNSDAIVNIIDLINQEKNMIDIWQTPTNTTKFTSEENYDTFTTTAEEEEVLPKEAPVLKITQPSHIVKKDTQWAVMLDCSKPVTDFCERIPEMAHKYKFELDTFQKQAILQLEKHNHVFVAAHTSAGKTVVAEYAIALSLKHMTRTIYTSPIKALSNQKYRDFRHTFKDVGLITGDFQINQTAGCLIMTTEILRSMLFNGSDVTRDLEFVIFDEVHYINDKERGHVWEQVLILLPAHVTVVLLSATVPNTIEFADWLGRMYQKRVYVVRTLERPVPLQHYLYTGTGGSTKNNRFLVLNETNTWVQDGYKKASESIPPLAPSAIQKKFTPQQEKTLWSALVDHLKRNDLLPVVAFTFSRAKCDMNAKNLGSLDLTTSKEKSKIHSFFEDCVKSLKEPDRRIPQILMMQEILKRGIGVHHSGVLPIIKEMVEMLFQNGLVKLLFATETFAMGVNMPARTVIFDSVRKHDGRELRNLLPAEYIQMAGRAGRRGSDKEGTVIILCKGKVPSSLELKDMMMGKPNQLKSQFRLTYGMVLSLLRVERLSVEGMMSRSFREADHARRMDTIREDLVKVEKNLEKECSRELSEYLQPLIKFFDRANEYLESRKQSLLSILQSHRVASELIPGRILLITHSNHINKLAMLLASNTSSAKIAYKVLILIDDRDDSGANQGEMWYKMLGLARNNVFVPVGTANHKIIMINPLDIFEITSKVIKIDPQRILADWDKRQMPRFKDSPIGESCKNAIQELLHMTISLGGENRAEIGMRYLDFIQDLKVDDALLYTKIKELNCQKELLLDHIACVQMPNFEDQFASVLEGDLTMKGRVSCGMGMNELIITELVFKNTLRDLQPAEVAALLSCLVFQAQTKKELADFTLTAKLKEGINKIREVHSKILSLELKYQISNDLGREEELNFGLVEVVYNWASEKPFAEIMELTDVQEGIIVRCIQQLYETISDVRSGAMTVGDPELQSKMEEASRIIKRDIVFAASLYTQREAYFI